MWRAASALPSSAALRYQSKACAPSRGTPPSRAGTSNLNSFRRPDCPAPPSGGTSAAPRRNSAAFPDHWHIASQRNFAPRRHPDRPPNETSRAPPRKSPRR